MILIALVMGGTAVAISSSLWEELVRAKSQPSRAYRTAQAGIDAADQTLAGFLKGQAISDSIRNRQLQRQTLGEALPGMVPDELTGLPVDQARNLVPLALAKAQLDRVNREPREPRYTPEDYFGELLRSGKMTPEAYAKIKRESSPNIFPKPLDPLDEELKRQRIQELQNAPGSPKAIANAFNLYKEASKGLESALEKVETGPIVGRLPAYTSAQQTADSAVAAMAPVLKQLFRVAGEGVFTDRDQALLLRMVTDRTIRPEARKTVLKNVDNIVRAKLGMPAESDNSDLLTMSDDELRKIAGGQ